MHYAFSLVCTAAFLFAPLQAQALTSNKTVSYRTTYHQSSPIASAGEYAGRMTLHFSSSGIVNGTYRDESGTTHQVSGGLTGDNLWLSFGMRGRHQFTGLVHDDGTITGTLSNWRGPRTYEFTAVPSTGP